MSKASDGSPTRRKPAPATHSPRQKGEGLLSMFDRDSSEESPSSRPVAMRKTSMSSSSSSADNLARKSQRRTPFDHLVDSPSTNSSSSPSGARSSSLFGHSYSSLALSTHQKHRDKSSPRVGNHPIASSPSSRISSEKALTPSNRSVTFSQSYDHLSAQVEPRHHHHAENDFEETIKRRRTRTRQPAAKTIRQRQLHNLPVLSSEHLERHTLALIGRNEFPSSCPTFSFASLAPARSEFHLQKVVDLDKHYERLGSLLDCIVRLDSSHTAADSDNVFKSTCLMCGSSKTWSRLPLVITHMAEECRRSKVDVADRPPLEALVDDISSIYDKYISTHASIRRTSISRLEQEKISIRQTKLQLRVAEFFMETEMDRTTSQLAAVRRLAQTAVDLTQRLGLTVESVDAMEVKDLSVAFRNAKAARRLKSRHGNGMIPNDNLDHDGDSSEQDLAHPADDLT